MKVNKSRPAKIIDLEADPDNPKLVKNVVVAVASIRPISPIAFRCPFCGLVHTTSEPTCKNPQSFKHVTDQHGKKRKLSKQWQFILELQTDEERYLAGDLSGWLRERGFKWAHLRKNPAQVPI